jgi:transcriptional regulator with XRE-family HTH domain
MDDKLDFSGITRSGFTQAEFGKLCGVHRVTVNSWVRGKMHPHPFIRTKVANVVRALNLALEAGLLPPKSMPPTPAGRIAAFGRALKDAAAQKAVN